MERKRIYNPESEEKTNERRIFGGDPTGIFELNDIKYQWAYNLWEMMLNNTWFPKEVDMTRDVNDYKHLTDAEKSAYDKVLAQLIFMDSLQTNNIMDNLNPFITSPEVNLIFGAVVDPDDPTDQQILDEDLVAHVWPPRRRWRPPSTKMTCPVTKDAPSR